MINKGELFKNRDFFIDYPFEEVMFRWDHDSRVIFKKFYGSEESTEAVSADNRLFNDAIQFGSEISSQEYINGKDGK